MSCPTPQKNAPVRSLDGRNEYTSVKRTDDHRVDASELVHHELREESTIGFPNRGQEAAHQAAEQHADTASDTKTAESEKALVDAETDSTDAASEI